MIPTKTRTPFAVLLLVASLAILSRPVGALTVYDPANYSQNVLQAARALEQIDNQIRALQNQAVMLQNMAKNLQRLDYSALGQIQGALTRIDGLMHQAGGIALSVDATQAALDKQFPGAVAPDNSLAQSVAAADERWRSTISAYRQTLMAQAAVTENIGADRQVLVDLLTASDSATGSLQAQQALNQLVALSTKQQLQIQTLMAAQYRATALDQARRAEDQAAAQAATRRFLGTGTAYTPQ